jgi:hypothetical protein
VGQVRRSLPERWAVGKKFASAVSLDNFPNAMEIGLLESRTRARGHGPVMESREDENEEDKRAAEEHMLAVAGGIGQTLGRRSWLWSR